MHVMTNAQPAMRVVLITMVALMFHTLMRPHPLETSTWVKYQGPTIKHLLLKKKMDLEIEIDEKVEELRE